MNIDLYKTLYLIRQSEIKIREYYAEDEMKTPMHMSMGEEAIAVGVCRALRPEDQVFGTYRSHALYLAKTQNAEDFFAEMFGKGTALLKGKGGSMHLCAPEASFMGTSAIVASNIPVAVGAAFANQQQGNDRLAAVFFGDGACDEGVFWESLNIACLMKLPIIFVCEDNGFAVHTPASMRQGYRSIIEVVSGYECSILQDKTTDVEVIYNLTLKAIESIKETQKPVFMHLSYYRYLEHVGVNEDFDAGYRSREEFEDWYKVDPVNLQRAKLLKQGIEDSAISDIEEEIKARVENSLKAAKDAPFADINTLFEGVYFS